MITTEELAKTAYDAYYEDDLARALETNGEKVEFENRNPDTQKLWISVAVAIIEKLKEENERNPRRQVS